MYVLSSSEGILGFFHSSKAAMTANKAYLELPETLDGNTLAKTATFSFGLPDEEDPTGISIMHNEECIMHHAPSAVYDLQGRKLADNPSSLISHPSSKPGIYIHKGKKIIIK